MRSWVRALASALEREIGVSDALRQTAKELKEALNEFEYLYGVASACVEQRAPSDDATISDHIEDIQDRALANMQALRAAIAKAEEGK